MKPFFNPDRLWPPGQRVLQLYVLPDLSRDHELAALIAGCRDVFTEFAAIDRPVPDDCLHVTVQPIGLGADEPVSPQARQALIAELAAAFATAPAFTTQVGSVLAYGTGVVADLHDDPPFDDLVERARTAITAVCGPDAATYDTRPAHMALAYAHGEQETDPVGRALRRVRPSHAPMTVDAVHLVDVEQVPEQCLFRWTPVHTFPLANNVNQESVA
ncbi:2'-5' RNA ligase family protein [Amycolatopsis sp. NPDC004378]